MKKPNVGKFLAAQAIRNAFAENTLPVCLEELDALCASETRPRLLAAYLRWQRARLCALSLSARSQYAMAQHESSRVGAESVFHERPHFAAA